MISKLHHLDSPLLKNLTFEDGKVQTYRKSDVINNFKSNYSSVKNMLTLFL